MTDLVQLKETFEGMPLTTMTIHDRPAWNAREVGEAIGYAQRGKRFATKITGDWSNEFTEGQDYQVITGKELLAFKDMFFKGTGSVPLASNRGMLVLFESGLHLALVKTRKAQGIRLRRFLVDKVLPQLVRTGTYSGEDEPQLPQLREQRLQQKADLEARRVAVLERNADANALRGAVRALHNLGQIDGATLAAYEVQAAEMVTGRDLSHLKPVGPTTWLTPTEIGSKLGLTAYRVGRLITELQLRGDFPGLARSYPHTPPHMDRPVRCYAYSAVAVRRIEAAALAGA